MSATTIRINRWARLAMAANSLDDSALDRERRRQGLMLVTRGPWRYTSPQTTSEDTMSTDSGMMHIGDTSIRFGDGWLVLAPGDPTDRQWARIRATANGLRFNAALWNERSEYVAYSVNRVDDSQDVYTVSPDGRDLRYVATVEADGSLVRVKMNGEREPF